MNVKKILKFYLVFTLLITGAASLSYSDVVKNYVPSFLYSGEDKYLKNSSFASTLHAIDFESSGESYVAEKAIKPSFSFEITNDVKKSFAKPGEQNVTFMEYKFKTTTEAIELNVLKLKILGMAPEKIKTVRLLDEDQEVLKEVRVNGEYLEFANISYKLDKNSEGKISFSLDLVEDLKTGERMRFDLEKPEDIGVQAAGKQAKINSYYPLKGKYLSIVNPRALSIPKVPPSVQ